MTQVLHRVVLKDQSEVNAVLGAIERTNITFGLHEQVSIVIDVRTSEGSKTCWICSENAGSDILIQMRAVAWVMQARDWELLTVRRPNDQVMAIISGEDSFVTGFCSVDGERVHFIPGEMQLRLPPMSK
jgi:hypothetical protein